MCLSSTAKSVKEFLATHKDQTSIIAYKILKLEDGKLRSIHYPNFDNDFWKEGEIVSSASPQHKLSKTTDRVVCNGIHVFLDLKDAKECKKIFYKESVYKLVPFTCAIANLLGAGIINGSIKAAVFRKVTLSKEDLNKALKKVASKKKAVRS